MRKKFLKNGVIAMMAVCGLAFVSCSEDNDEGMKSYKLTVSYSLPSDVEASNVEELKLILGSTAKNDTLSLDANSKEIELPQGQYKVTVTGKVADEAKAYLSGSTSVDLYANTPVTVNLQKVMQSSLIFKTIHNSGSKQYYMHESYFEIVNNSDEVQYLDNLILTAPTGNQQTANAWQANGYEDLYACGQGSVVAFPGNGHDYPLQPGKSVLIANDATNHKLAYGEDASQAADYASCPDLSNADWEIYLNYNGLRCSQLENNLLQQPIYVCLRSGRIGTVLRTGQVTGRHDAGSLCGIGVERNVRTGNLFHFYELSGHPQQICA